MKPSSAALALVLVVVAVSCLSGRMIPQDPVEKTVPTAKGPPPTLTDDPNTRVDTLYADLVTHREALSLPTPPRGPDESCEPVCVIEDPPDKPSRTPGCSPGSGSACAAACSQADAACDDAAQICAIAKELRTEEEPARRCREARTTCADAHAPCCGCTSQ